MVPAFFRSLVTWDTQLTNWPWLLAPSAHAAMRSEIVQPLGNTVLGTAESHPSMTTVARRSESEQSSSALLTPSPSASDTGHAGTGTVLRSQLPITPDAWRQAAGPLQELLPTVVPLGKLKQASVPLQELSPTVTPVTTFRQASVPLQELLPMLPVF